jgi:hypothetical protein
LDTILISAYQQLQAESPFTSADEIICDPVLRRRFLDLASKDLHSAPEREVLHRLINLRKRKKLPRLK